MRRHVDTLHAERTACAETVGIVTQTRSQHDPEEEHWVAAIRATVQLVSSWREEGVAVYAVAGLLSVVEHV